MDDQRDYGDENYDQDDNGDGGSNGIQSMFGGVDVQSLLTEDNFEQAEGFLQSGDTGGLASFAMSKLGGLFGMGGNDSDTQDDTQSYDAEDPDNGN